MISIKQWGIITVSAFILFLGIGITQGQIKVLTNKINTDVRLISGQPIVNAAHAGHFDLKSISMQINGLVDVDGDKKVELFVQSDKWYPGIYLYSLESLDERGVPVFSQPKRVETINPAERGIVVQGDDGEVYGFFSRRNSLRLTRLLKDSLKFVQVRTLNIEGLPANYGEAGVVKLAQGGYLFLFTHIVGKTRGPHRGPLAEGYNVEGFWPYDLPKVSVYGGYVKDLNEKSIKVNKLTSDNECYYTMGGFTNFRSGKEDFILAGDRTGNMFGYPMPKYGAGSLDTKSYAVDVHGVRHRTPTMYAFPHVLDLPGKENYGVIVAGEGGLYFYKSVPDQTHKLTFENPVSLLVREANLYGGSLVVPELVDWDGDGHLDIISGNSLGHVLFYKNVGNNAKPLYANPELIKAGGEVIHVQPGYREDIQGPQESRWGYTCPAVVDWNEDGRPDILLGDSRGKFMAFMNTGSRTSPKLEREKTLYVQGMDMHGAWRVKPGVGKLGDRMAYIVLDRDNEAHLYWREDNYNISDGGKLSIGDSIPIKGTHLNAGAVGRLKFHLVDWDRDGVKDLLIGTPRHATVPSPDIGLPFRLKKNGSSVLFLRNSGTNEKPVFEFPKMLKFKGEDILLGQHACSPTTGYLGGDGKTLNLIVGTECGTFIYYDRKDLSW